jgi:hypothetical protein
MSPKDDQPPAQDFIKECDQEEFFMIYIKPLIIGKEKAQFKVLEDKITLYTFDFVVQLFTVISTFATVCFDLSKRALVAERRKLFKEKNFKGYKKVVK